MKIEEKGKETKCTVKDIGPGECFRFVKTYYIMTDKKSYAVNGTPRAVAVNIKTGEVDDFHMGTEVRRVDATVVVEHEDK